MRTALIRTLWLWTLLAALFAAGAAPAATLTRDQALAALEAVDPMDRFVALERLAEVGAMQDADAVLERLADADPRVRLSASHAIWQIWSRSGNAAIDELLAHGVEQMNAGALAGALHTFDEVVRRRPDFAEGWNKRATVKYLLGQYQASLLDCEEVFERNPRHFGALTGAAQIYLRQGRAEQALGMFRRAVAINPNLDAAARIIPLIEQRLRELEKNTI
ncbi:MAG: tetratricopeptide repeat protein [Burkholderiales bacterium]